MATDKVKKKVEERNPYDDFDGPASPQEAAPHQYLNPPSTAPGDVRDDENNPYLQFDGPGDGEYDKMFGTDTSEGRKYTAQEIPGAALANTPPSAMQFIGNMWNAITRPDESIPAIGKMVGGAALNTVSPETRAMIIKDHPYAQEMIDAANAVGGFYAKRYGSWDAAAQTFAKDPVGFAADASSLLTGVGGVARGAGAMATRLGATNAAGVAGKVGRLANGAAEWTNPVNALNKPADLAIKGARGVNELLNPQKAMIKRAAEGKLPELHTRLTDPAIVRSPGNVPNAGQAVADLPGGAPTRFQALVKAAEKEVPTKSYEVKGAQGNARLADIDNVSRNHDITPEQITRAGGSIDPARASIPELDRAIAAADSHNYGLSDAVMTPADDRLFEILNLPHNKDILDRAMKLAAQEERPFGVGTYVPATPARTVANPAMGPGVMTTIPATPAQYPRFSGADLHTLKRAFDNLAFERKNANGISADEVRAIQGARDKFLQWVEDPSRNPQYGIARSDRATWEKLRARRQAMELFKDTLAAPLMGADQAAQKAIALRNLMDSPKNAVKGNAATGKATDFNPPDNWAEILTPEDLDILQRNLDDLSRNAQYEGQARAAGKYAKELTGNPETIQAPGLLSAPVTVLNSLLRRIGEHTRGRISEKTSNAMMHPDSAAELLNQVIEWENRNNRFESHARTIGRGVKRIPPAGYNALDAERQDRERRNALR